MGKTKRRHRWEVGVKERTMWLKVLGAGNRGMVAVDNSGVAVVATMMWYNTED
jgi:hypothetical protein